MLRWALPLHLRHHLCLSILDSCGISDLFVHTSPEHCNSAECYSFTTSPSTLDWLSAYSSDPSLSAIKSYLSTKPTLPPSKNILSTIAPSYHTALLEQRIIILHDKLVLLKPIFKNEKYVALTIVPPSLCQSIFDHFHSGPTGAHMGEYKTLFRIRMRFFWPGIRNQRLGKELRALLCIQYLAQQKEQAILQLAGHYAILHNACQFMDAWAGIE